MKDWDDWERWQAVREIRKPREDLFDGIVKAEHVGVTELVPYLTVIPEMSMPLAVRCDAKKFNVTQALYGILRAGSQGFGLAQAYGADKTKGATSFVTQINEDPHGKRTVLVAPLLPGVTIFLGGNSKLVPEVASEGLDFTISADERGEVRIKAKSLGKNPFQILTAISPMSQRYQIDNTPLDEEVGIWSMPPSYLKHVLRLK